MTDGDRQQILGLLAAQEDAIARSDGAAALAPVAAHVVSYDLPPPLEYRGDAARSIKELERWFATWEGAVTVHLTNPTVLLDGDLAVVFGLSQLRGVKKNGGLVDSWNRRCGAIRLFGKSVGRERVSCA